MWRQTISHALKIKIVLVSLCLFASAGAAAVGAHRLLSSPPAPKDVAASPPPAAPVAREDVGLPEGEVVVVNLRPEGFEPAELTLPAGEYLFVVNNRTGLDEFAPRLDREGQGTVSHVRTPRHKRNWRQMHRLTPGVYTMTETGHPDWTLRLTVTPR